MDDDGADSGYAWGSPPRHRERYTRPQCSPCLNVTEHGTGVASSSGRTGGKNSASSSVSIDDTPRKMRRMQAMKNARFNQTGQSVSTLPPSCSAARPSNQKPFSTTHSMSFFCWLFSRAEQVGDDGAEELDRAEPPVHLRQRPPRPLGDDCTLTCIEPRGRLTGNYVTAIVSLPSPVNCYRRMFQCTALRLHFSC